LCNNVDDYDDDNNNNNNNNNYYYYYKRLVYLCQTQLYVNKSDQQHVLAGNKGIVRLQIRIAKRDT